MREINPTPEKYKNFALVSLAEHFHSFSRVSFHIVLRNRYQPPYEMERDFSSTLSHSGKFPTVELTNFSFLVFPLLNTQDSLALLCHNIFA